VVPEEENRENPANFSRMGRTCRGVSISASAKLADEDDPAFHPTETT
jgi:hypothetical protein